MMLPIMTLQSLLEYNDSLFDDIVLPDGAVRELLVQQIIAHYGEMQPICVDWPALKYYIDSWFASHQMQLQHLWNDYVADYNPVYNKDAYYEEVRTPDLVHTDTHRRDVSGMQKTDSTGQSSSAGRNTHRESGSTKQQYQGFNSSSFNDVTNTVPDTTDTDEGITAVNDHRAGNTDTHNVDEGTSQRTDTGTERVSRHEYGNVGVTMASQMLRDDTDFWRGFSWYSMAARLWAVDNLVMIY